MILCHNGGTSCSGLGTTFGSMYKNMFLFFLGVKENFCVAGNPARRCRLKNFKVHLKNLFFIFLTVLYCCDGGESDINIIWRYLCTL